jgi:diguanylate cyclase (GGDEF)-like protein/PAS domain S-box-containing protein
VPALAAERARLKALRELHLLDSAPEPEFDAITRLAARLFGVPVALISLVDRKRQWFKSRVGLDFCETARDIAFCSHAIQHGGLFEIPDAAQDPRFASNPLVTGENGIRYYAGIPLVLSSGYAVGTLCLIDTAPRAPLADEQVELLETLARLATLQIEMRRARRFGSIAEAIGESIPEAVVCCDADGRIIYWNKEAERLFGHKEAQALGRGIDIIVPPEHRGSHDGGIARLKAGGKPKLLGKSVELPAMHKDGSRLEIELSLASWQDERGEMAGFAARIRDLSARKAMERERDESREFLHTIVENLPAMLFVKDVDDLRYRVWNGAAEAMTGIPRCQVIGRTDAELVPQVADEYTYRDKRALATAGKPSVFESRFTRPDGGERILRTQRLAVDDAHGKRILLGITEDMTERRAAQEEMAFLAGHDSLTGLVNRERFVGRVEQAISAHQETAVIIVDIDRFKAVNSTHGHQAGDLLLAAVARVLREAVGPKASGKHHALVARLGGDEFGIVLSGPGAARESTRIGRAVDSALAQPVLAGDLVLQGPASIGIAATHSLDLGSENLINSATLALRRAKASGGARVCFFERQMDDAAKRQRLIETRLRAAIGSPRLRLHYQPVASLNEGRVVAFEALVRWHDEELGDVPPDVFIPVAEESGLIVPLGLQILRAAASEAATWQPALKVCVNLSPVQIQRGGLSESIEAILRETGLDPARLELEITEGVLMQDGEAVAATLRQLKALGVSIAMDDFGTGFSSLSYFQRFHFDKVKIDQSFVRDMDQSPEALAIVQAVVGLAHGLGLPVVAEGVEREDQLELLRKAGYDLVQGFLLGRPAPIEAFEGVVIDRGRREADCVDVRRQRVL